ncbi:MAG TPA: hypothetical protein VG319_08740 [Polyangia bacterium]|jgi:hypothetical protein|nr:hypothetical protein [Polyangia bacterium]
MQVVCGNCQLTFDAPEGATGLVCPICRNPLQQVEAAAAGNGAAKPVRKIIDWNGGTLTDLIALLSAPAVSARVEVIPVGADTPIGEVHLVAGGVSDSIYAGEATDDALDKLLTITPARFRVEPRLPNPKTGELGTPGPEAGTLDGRPLAHLMRYCEDYVITCAIDVWRGNETARVDYRRGEISGVTVGGIDAPERLAEVMQWASGNYRLNLPPIQLPAVAPKRTTAGVMPIVSSSLPLSLPSAPEPASGGPAGAKTIFGMPQSEIAAARAAAEAIMQAQGVGTPAPPDVAPPPVADMAPSPAAAPAPLAASRASATKTMFGVPAPELPQGFVPVGVPLAAAPGVSARATEPALSAEAGPTAVVESDTARAERISKTGARKVAVPAPEIGTATIIGTPAPAAAKEAGREAGKDVGRTTQFGFEARPAGAPPSGVPKKVDPKSDKSEKTKPVRAPAAPRQTERQGPLWTYVGVGFAFGLALLGIYQLVGRLAH